MTTKLTSRDIKYIEECHPILQQLFYAAAKSKDCPPFRVLDGKRTLAEQKKLVAKGSSTTMRSRHLPAKNGWSHAIDVAPLVKGKISWKWKYYYPLEKAIKKIANELGLKGLEWGGDWKNFKDGPHWQLSWRLFSGKTEYADHIEPDSEIVAIEQKLNTKPKPREGVGNFRVSIPLVLDHEGGFNNDPDDVGGATNKGITLKTYRQYIDPKGTVQSLKNMTTEQAVDVYKQQYWDKCRCDMLPLGVDHAVFDFAVNSGPIRAKTFLQSVVATPVDGKIGPATLNAVNAMSSVHVINGLCAERIEYIKERVKTGKLHEKFEDGIIKRIERVRKEALAMLEKEPKEQEKVSTAPPGKSVFGLLFNLLRSLFGGK